MVKASILYARRQGSQFDLSLIKPKVLTVFINCLVRPGMELDPEPLKDYLCKLGYSAGSATDYIITEPPR